MKDNGMRLGEVIGCACLALLACLWWLRAPAPPQVRKGARRPGRRLRIVAVKGALVLLAAAAVAVLHMWAAAPWQVGLVVVAAAAAGWLLIRHHRRLVAAPGHRIALGRPSKWEPTVPGREPDPAVDIVSRYATREPWVPSRGRHLSRLPRRGA